MIRQFEEQLPKISSSCYIDPSAEIIGDVIIGENSSVWPFTVIRGDVNYIRIGSHSNIQDGSVLHVSHAGEYNADGAALNVGDYVTVGHKVILHACTIGDYSLIGMGSIVLDDAVIEDHVMLGAGSLVTQGKRLQSGYLYLGSPCQQIRKLNEKEIQSLQYSAEHYVRLTNRHAVSSAST